MADCREEIERTDRTFSDLNALGIRSANGLTSPQSSAGQ
jgi:hypothetical protein